MVTWDVMKFSSLLSALPEQLQTSKVVKQLSEAYLAEMDKLLDYLKEGLKDSVSLEIKMMAWRVTGSQYICEFWVNDLSIPLDPAKTNWHGQRTSQWLYAGAIVVDKAMAERDADYIVSRHH